MIFATLGFTPCGQGPSLNIVGVMIFWHVILGTGVGGGYPLSSIITSEFAIVKWRGVSTRTPIDVTGFGRPSQTSSVRMHSGSLHEDVRKPNESSFDLPARSFDSCRFYLHLFSTVEMLCFAMLAARNIDPQFPDGRTFTTDGIKSLSWPPRRRRCHMNYPDWNDTCFPPRKLRLQVSPLLLGSRLIVDRQV